MEAIDLQQIIQLAPSVAVLVYIIHKQQKRLDTVTDYLVGCYERNEDDDKPPS